MINFIVFFLSFVANLVIVKMMPNENLRAYINIYNIVGGCGALAFFVIYSREAFTQHIRKIGVGLMVVQVLAHITLDGFWASVAVYPLLLIYNDYIVTQSNLVKGRYLYRLFLIFSLLPFLFLQNQFEILFQARVILLSGVLFYYTLSTKEVAALQVQSPWKYIFFNYTFYYAPLILIANISLTASALKVWYIFSQGGLVLYLKYLDFALRKNHTVSRHLNSFTLLAAVGAPILPVCLFPSVTGLVTYAVGLLGLVYSKRYIKIKTS